MEEAISFSLSTDYPVYSCSNLYRLNRTIIRAKSNWRAIGIRATIWQFLARDGGAAEPAFGWERAAHSPTQPELHDGINSYDNLRKMQH